MALFNIIALNADPIYCEGDPCHHMIWLLRDNRHLLKQIHDGKCTNGNTFQEVEMQLFDHCPV